MSRTVCLLLACALCAVSQPARGWTLSGAIIIATNPNNSSVRSNADVTVYDGNGNIDYTQLITGYHSIYVSGYGSAIIAGNSVSAVGRVFSFIVGTGVPGQCYDARIVGQNRGLTYDEIVGPRCVALPPPPPDCKSSTSWDTTVLDLSAGGVLQLPESFDKSPRLSTEVRMDESGEKTYILDQWAILDSSRHVARSSAATVETGWLRDIAGLAPSGPLLVIQSPVHATPMPAPAVRFDAEAANAYVRSLRPQPRRSKVAVRLEFSPGGSLLNREVLRGDQQLGLHFAESLSIEALNGHNHRTIVFALFEVRSRGVRLVSARPVLAKCCCGQWNPHCI